MRALASIAAVLAMGGSAWAQWSDDFNRANGPIGGNWTVVSGTWAILNNQGTHTSTSSSTILQHSLAATPNYAATVTTLDVFSNAGTTSYFAGVLIGLGGTDTIMVKMQDQVTTPAGFSNIGLYHKTSATGWGAWTGTGTGFATLTAPVVSGQLKVYFTNGGDTLVAELDTDFNGSPDQTYTKTGVLALAPNLGTGHGITGWGNMGAYGLFDNWAVSGGAPADACANANPLFGNQSGDTTTATNDGTSTCDATGNDYWYKYTAGATGGQLSLDTCGSAIDTVLSVYTGACGALTEIACNDDATGTPCAAPASALTLTLAPSQAIIIRLSDKGVGGAYTLNSSYVANPANDTCASAAALTTAQATGNTLLATNDGSSSCDLTGNDVWFSYTAPAAAGTLSLNTCGSAIDAVISVYDACGGNLLACDDNSAACGGGAASVAVALNASQLVLIRVSDKGTGGTFVLNESYGIPVCNGSALSTLFASNNGLSTGSCVFFDVDVTNPSGISLSQLDTNVSATAGTQISLAVWTRTGTYVGSEQTTVGWTNVANGIGLAAGQDLPTTVEFTDVPLPFGVTGFALVITGGGHRYTNALTSPPNTFYSNADLSITLGKSQSVPFSGAPIAGRVWNGTVRYNCVYGPTAYCTIGTTTNGCLPSISGNNNPDVAHSNSCVITVSNVEGQQSGILFYGLTTSNSPWCSQGGGNSFLCVKSPLERTGVQNSGGTFGACDGALTLDWNAYQIAYPTATGNPWSAGDKAYVQGWFRDPPSCKTTFLSNALELTYQP